YRAASGYGPITAQWSGVQYWRGGTAFQGTYQIQNVTSGQVLNNGGSTANGSPITQWHAETSVNEYFTFEPTSNGYFRITSAQSGLDLNNSGGGTANNTPVTQWAWANSPNEQWKPVLNSDGTWAFYNLTSGLTLNNPGGSTAQGTQYTQWSWANSPNEKCNLIQVAP